MRKVNAKRLKRANSDMRFAAAQGERVDLNVARRHEAGHDLLARMAGDGVLEPVVAPGAPVCLHEPRLHAGLAFERAAHGRGAHPQDVLADLRGDGGHERRVLLHPPGDVGLEVGRARAARFAPYGLEHFEGLPPYVLPRPLRSR